MEINPELSSEITLKIGLGLAKLCEKLELPFLTLHCRITEFYADVPTDLPSPTATPDMTSLAASS